MTGLLGMIGYPRTAKFGEIIGRQGRDGDAFTVKSSPGLTVLICPDNLAAAATVVTITVSGF
jgi:hypothetical protein